MGLQKLHSSSWASWAIFDYVALLLRLLLILQATRRSLPNEAPLARSLSTLLVEDPKILQINGVVWGNPAVTCSRRGSGKKNNVCNRSSLIFIPTNNNEVASDSAWIRKNVF
jgi:hypothetical protein